MWCTGICSRLCQLNSNSTHWPTDFISKLHFSQLWNSETELLGVAFMRLNHGNRRHELEIWVWFLNMKSARSQDNRTVVSNSSRLKLYVAGDKNEIFRCFKWRLSAQWDISIFTTCALSANNSSSALKTKDGRRPKLTYAAYRLSIWHMAYVQGSGWTRW